MHIRVNIHFILWIIENKMHLTFVHEMLRIWIVWKGFCGSRNAFCLQLHMSKIILLCIQNISKCILSLKCSIFEYYVRDFGDQLHEMMWWIYISIDEMQLDLTLCTKSLSLNTIFHVTQLIHLTTLVRLPSFSFLQLQQGCLEATLWRSVYTARIFLFVCCLVS